MPAETVAWCSGNAVLVGAMLAAVALSGCGKDDPQPASPADSSLLDGFEDETDELVDQQADLAERPSDLAEVEAETAEERDTFGDTRGWGEYSHEMRDLVAFVDPMLGTRGSGNVIPGALLPHGMVRASPVTTENGSDIAAYSYSSDRFQGISHTHLQGAGGSANGYSHILVSASTADLTVERGAYDATFTHENEEARPGYYSVELDSGISTAVTVAQISAVHRYTFPSDEAAHIVINLGDSLGQSIDGSLEIEGGDTVSGFAEYQVHPVVSRAVNDGGTGEVRVYFWVRFDQEFESHTVWQSTDDAELDDDATEVQGRLINAALTFENVEPLTVELRLGLSLISVGQARTNAETELGDLDFDEVAQSASEQWNARLNRIQVDGGENELVIFYSALYHAMFQPADYTESGGRFFTAADGRGAVHEAQRWRYLTDDWCLWDTYRTSHPLRTLVEPEIIDDYVRSLLHVRREGGWLPKCPWNASGYSRVMTGNPAIPIIADALIKGFDRYDTAEALEAVVDLSTEDDNPFPSGLCGYLGLGTPPEYVENGYVSHECDSSQSASMTLEFAYADYCVAEMAGALGQSETESIFRQRAQNYRHHWDDEAGFMRGLDADGDWVEPFDPADRTDFNDFVEASSWIFSFFVPHDVPGLIELMGGSSELVAKLDQFFEGGHYDPTNQPSFHIPFLYNFAGAPSQTQARVRATIGEHYGSGPGGLPGNDDAGSTSAWYILGALGIFPVAPCSPVYELSSPIFSRAEIFLASGYQSGTSFVIRVEGDPTDVYIQSATLNGEELERPWITHSELTAGGELVFQLGPEPSDWGSEAVRP